MAIVLLTAVAALAGCDDERPKQSASVVGTNGVKLTLPPGWSGRSQAVGTSLAHLEVANFLLGRQPRPKRLRAGQMVLVVSESEVAGDLERRPIARVPDEARISITPRDFLPRSSPRRPLGHQVALYSFAKQHRFFDVEVTVGGAAPPPARAARQLNEVLETVVIEPRP